MPIVWAHPCSWYVTTTGETLCSSTRGDASADTVPSVKEYDSTLATQYQTCSLAVLAVVMWRKALLGRLAWTRRGLSGQSRSVRTQVEAKICNRLRIWRLQLPESISSCNAWIFSTKSSTIVYLPQLSLLPRNTINESRRQWRWIQCFYR